MKAPGKYIIPLLAGISFIAWVIAFLLPQFPWTITLAVAPIFALYAFHKEKNLPFTSFGISVAGTLVLSYVVIASFIKNGSPGIPLSINYGIIMSFAFFAYWLTDTHAKNRLGLVTIVIFYAGIEYISMIFVPEYAHFLLGSSLSEFPAIQRWNTQSGITGVSAWILLANIGTYFVLFRNMAIFNGIFRWRSLLLSAVLISIPGIISYWILDPTIGALNAGEVADGFRNIITSGKFDSAGEITGRTCAWVTVLIVIYGLVKRKVTP
ncbi:hypothetical protein [Fulvivirga sedimenti]|uniref:Uncharacterized protein n=1 Tax=Fulvivirga sedimenti TaxID=2879465 RepID=A0A9X1HVM5_9BACT|nr:hypothetical protein [Fulvivirga sedimenti]MCA6078190.1 hypothetical protein [Fulvivirga sedimenti]